jgi:urocanate hydratase
MITSEFHKLISQGIPEELPVPKPFDENLNHAPRRRDILNGPEKILAIKNALRYFPVKYHKVLATEFANELYVQVQA